MVRSSLTAENTWTDTIDIPADNFSLSVWGTFVATISVQKTFDGGTTWLAVEDFTTPGEYIGTEPEGSKYRVGIKTGYYTSGTVELRLAV